MIQELVSKYLWLVDVFSAASPRGLSLEQIMERWEARWGEPYNRRSFFNHRAAILDIFDVEIKCNRSKNLYYIDLEELESNKSKASWLINSFTVNNLLALSKEGLAGRVSVENVPSGQKWLSSIMNSMLGSEELEISYLKYTGEPLQKRTILPYAVKETAKRWYLIGQDQELKALRVYGLDRIHSIKATGKHFRLPEDFDVDFLFKNSYGAYITDSKDLKHIVLKATEKEAKYLRDLPLHHSQKEPEPGIFTLDLSVTEDFVMELLSRGNRLEVLEPMELRYRIRFEFIKAAEIYKNT
ncbi:MAG: WYL domain-containing protein [Bacteroidales bacterium]|nr:WYL domain-containing protein [Bacteroidales bacterium]